MSTKRPYVPICKWALYVCKRALYVCEQALCTYLQKSPLHILLSLHIALSISLSLSLSISLSLSLYLPLSLALALPLFLPPTHARTHAKALFTKKKPYPPLQKRDLYAMKRDINALLVHTWVSKIQLLCMWDPCNCFDSGIAILNRDLRLRCVDNLHARDLMCCVSQLQAREPLWKFDVLCVSNAIEGAYALLLFEMGWQSSLRDLMCCVSQLQSREPL